MNKTLNQINKCIIAIACALVIFTFSKPLFKDSQPFLNVNPQDVISLEKKIVGTISMHSLTNFGANAYLNKSIFSIAMGKLSKRGPQNLEIPLLIDSYGGYLGLMGQTARVMQFTRMLGIKYTCYVTNAYSAAFFLLVTQCSKRIVLRGAKVGQHLTHIGNNMTTADAILDSRKMSRAEAKALGIEEERWYRITRKVGKDKDFSEKEMIKYGIATEIYERTKSSSK
jgi:hypothetical protein